jgi:hypothetical protein
MEHGRGTFGTGSASMSDTESKLQHIQTTASDLFTAEDK